MTELSFMVYGTPAPQGSKRSLGNGVMVESSKALQPWRDAVTAAAVEATRDLQDWPAPQAVAVQVTFFFRRPKSHYRTGKNSHLLRDSAPYWHFTKPDVDKLERSSFDALVAAGLMLDDSRIVCSLASKAYAEQGEPTGASFTITAVDVRERPAVGARLFVPARAGVA